MQKPDKRELILNSARGLFNKFGFKKTTIDEVVREAGVAKGTFYLYFKSKEELFVETIKSIREEMMSEYFKYIEKSDTPAKKLEGTLRFALEMLDKHPLFSRITAKDEELKMVLTMVDDPSTKELQAEALGPFLALFQQGIDDGELRENIDQATIPIIFGILKFMHFYKDLVVHLGINSEQFNDAIIDLAMNGILKK
jgi:AcrR family transcriptional regulator